MPVQIRASTLDLNQEEVTVAAHHRPQVCAVDEHLPPPMNSRFVQWETICSAAIRQCVVCALGHHVLLESKEEQLKEPREPGRQSYRKLGKKASEH